MSSAEATNNVAPVVGVSVLTAVVTNPAAREAVIAGGTAVLKAIAKNPKLAVGFACIAVIAYGIKRVTGPGTKLKVGSFLKFKRD
jgi:hypothetical protein